MRSHRGLRKLSSARGILTDTPYVPSRKNELQHDPINEERSRIVSPEFGAGLGGDREGRIFDAAAAHIAHRQPEPLGATGLGLVRRVTGEGTGNNA